MAKTILKLVSQGGSSGSAGASSTSIKLGDEFSRQIGGGEELGDIVQTTERHPETSRTPGSPGSASSGEVFLDLYEGEAFDWRNPTGPTPGVMTITVSTATDKLLQGLANPIKLVCKGAHIGGGIESTDFEINDLYLAERLGFPNPADPHIVQWTIEDNRRFAVGLQSLGEMNLQRIANEFGSFITGNFGQFHRIGKFAYYVPTAKDPGGIRFARFNSENYSAWTALEALVFMLTGFFDLAPGRALLPSGKPFRPTVTSIGSFAELENGFPLSSFSLSGPWPSIVESLKRLAHVDFAPNAKGEWVLFRLDPKAVPRNIGGYIGGGNPINRDRRRIRSITHRTIFRTRYEFRADYVEEVSTGDLPASFSTTTGEEQILPIKIDNVVITPFDMDDNDNGVKVLRGSIRTFTDFIRLVNQDPSTNFPANFVRAFGTLKLRDIKKLIHGPTLAFFLTNCPERGGGRHPRGAAIAKTIYDFWRRLFQIPRTLRDNLRGLRAQSTEVVDTKTGTQAPSRVYCDHTMVSTYWGAQKTAALNHGEGNGFSTLRPWPITDSIRRLADAEPSDYLEVAVKDEGNGLFMVSELTDISGTFGRVLLTTYQEGKMPPNAVGIDGTPKFLESCPQDEKFRLSFLFSGEPISANPENYFIVDKPADEEPTDGLGPVHEDRVREAFAGYAWDEDKSLANVDSVSGQIVFDGFEVYNKGRLESIALGLRQQHYFRQLDWLIGNYRAPGFDPNIDFPAGNYSVFMTFADGFFEAAYQFREPRGQPLFELLDPQAAALLYRRDEELR